MGSFKDTHCLLPQRRGAPEETAEELPPLPWPPAASLQGPENFNRLRSVHAALDVDLEQNFGTQMSLTRIYNRSCAQWKSCRSWRQQEPTTGGLHALLSPRAAFLELVDDRKLIQCCLLLLRKRVKDCMFCAILRQLIGLGDDGLSFTSSSTRTVSVSFSTFAVSFGMSASAISALRWASYKILTIIKIPALLASLKAQALRGISSVCWKQPG